MAATLSRRGGLEPSAAHLALIRQETHDQTWQTACEQLLDAWETVVQGMSRHYAFRRADRPDFAQVARLALLRAARGYQKLPGRCFEHYARRVVRNALLDEACRAAEKHPDPWRMTPPAAAENPLAILLRREADRLVRQRVRAWSPRLRVLVDYLFAEDLSQVQAARRLGLTPARVNQLLHKIRRNGRRDLDDVAEPIRPG